MAIQQMKSDIKPLCDRHLVEMEELSMRAKMGPFDVWIFPAFRCATQGCTRSFDSGGYTTISEGSVDPQSRNFIGCEDGVMFIESAEADRLIWLYSKAGCQLSRTTDHAFQPRG